MKRNPDATCETCPYFKYSPHEKDGLLYSGRCWVVSAVRWHGDPLSFQLENWCGEHPDFEQVETEGE